MSTSWVVTGYPAPFAVFQGSPRAEWQPTPLPGYDNLGDMDQCLSQYKQPQLTQCEIDHLFLIVQSLCRA